MTATRELDVTIRITGDTGIPDAQVIAKINALLDMPGWRIAEELANHGVIDELDDACPACGTRIRTPNVTPAVEAILPVPGRWKVVPK